MSTVLGYIIACGAAFLSSACFAQLYHAPAREFVFTGLTGAFGWLIYRLITENLGRPVVACFAAALGLSLLARYFAVYRKCPATIFIISGILPLVPGAGIYYTAYHIIMGEDLAAMAKLFETLKYAAAICLGLSLAFTLPYGAFSRLAPRKFRFLDVHRKKK